MMEIQTCLSRKYFETGGLVTTKLRNKCHSTYQHGVVLNVQADKQVFLYDNGLKKRRAINGLEDLAPFVPWYKAVQVIRFQVHGLVPLIS